MGLIKNGFSVEPADFARKLSRSPRDRGIMDGFLMCEKVAILIG